MYTRPNPLRPHTNSSQNLHNNSTLDCFFCADNFTAIYDTVLFLQYLRFHFPLFQNRQELLELVSYINATPASSVFEAPPLPKAPTQIESSPGTPKVGFQDASSPSRARWHVPHNRGAIRYIRPPRPPATKEPARHSRPENSNARKCSFRWRGEAPSRHCPVQDWPGWLQVMPWPLALRYGILLCTDHTFSAF